MNTLEILGTLALIYLGVGAVTAILSNTEPEEEDGWLEYVKIVYVLVVAWPLVWMAGISAGVREVFRDSGPPPDNAP